METTRTHLDRMKENLTFEELLEINDLDHDAVLQLLYDMGYLIYPEDRVDPDYVSEGYDGIQH